MNPNLGKECFDEISRELGKVIIGQERVVKLLVASLFARGHCLLIGVPGLAKTMLARTIAQVIGLEFRRIQFTPDLMPADILGADIVREKDGQLAFEYQPGPIFANLLLADEINRTPPKTQSALLEAMQEHKVTVAGATRPLPDPFLVIATQNPIEQEGTYPLPEAQLDRFMFSLRVRYPTIEEERRIVRQTTIGGEWQAQEKISREKILQIQELVRDLPVADHIIDYAVDLVVASRPDDMQAADISRKYVEWGAGPRASQYLIMGAKALALIHGRCTPEVQDVQEIALEVLEHRIVLNYRATGEGIKSRDVVEKLLETIREPYY